jgi:hypothetical protein
MPSYGTMRVPMAHSPLDGDALLPGLLRALSGPPLHSEDESRRVIERASEFFSLQDIALLLVADAEESIQKGDTEDDAHDLLDRRVENFCSCLTRDDAYDFQQFVATELDARSM